MHNRTHGTYYVTLLSNNDFKARVIVLNNNGEAVPADKVWPCLVGLQPTVVIPRADSKEILALVETRTGDHLLLCTRISHKASPVDTGFSRIGIPAISADGRYIAFPAYSSTPEAGRGIWLLDLEAKTAERLSEDRGPSEFDTYPRFSSYGKALVWLRATRTPKGIVTKVIVRSDSGENTEVDSVGVTSSADFAPDSSSGLVAWNNSGLVTIKLGETPQVILSSSWRKNKILVANTLAALPFHKYAAFSLFDSKRGTSEMYEVDLHTHTSTPIFEAKGQIMSVYAAR